MYSITTTRKPGIASSKRWPFVLRRRIRILPKERSMVFGALFLMAAHVALGQEQRGSDFTGGATRGTYGTISLSADGTILAIGDSQNTGGGVPTDRPGYVQVFEWTGSEWQQRGSDIIGKSLSDAFGAAVSLSADGTIMAVGAPGNSDAGRSAGALRVYAWDGSDWSQRGIDINGAAAEDSEGFPVSLSADGSVVASNSPGYRTSTGSGKRVGRVRIHEWDGAEWKQRGDDFLGLGYGLLPLDGDGKVVALNRGGSIQVLEWNGTAWVQLGDDIKGKVDGENVAAQSLSSDGHVLALGFGANTGLRIYDWNGASWVQRGDDINENSIRSISLSGSGTIVAMNPGGDLDAKVFEWNGSAWVQVAVVEPDPDEERPDPSNLVLSSDGYTLATGNRFANVVRVYDLTRVLPVEATGLPEAFFLSAAYPNPFNPATTFSLTLERTQPVRVSVVDLLGREVALLHEGVLAAGVSQTFTFEAGRLPTGQYLIRVVGESFVASRGVVLVK